MYYDVCVAKLPEHSPTKWNHPGGQEPLHMVAEFDKGAAVQRSLLWLFHQDDYSVAVHWIFHIEKMLMTPLSSPGKRTLEALEIEHLQK